MTQAKTNRRKTTDVNSTLVSKNITIHGRRTSVRLEPEMWLAIKEISLRERCSVHDLCTLVQDNKKENSSLTAAIRVFLMLYYRSATTEEGHIRAGHGDFKAMRERALQRHDKGLDLEKKNVPIYEDYEVPRRSASQAYVTRFRDVQVRAY